MGMKHGIGEHDHYTVQMLKRDLYMSLRCVKDANARSSIIHDFFDAFDEGFYSLFVNICITKYAKGFKDINDYTVQWLEARLKYYQEEEKMGTKKYTWEMKIEEIKNGLDERLEKLAFRRSRTLRIIASIEQLKTFNETEETISEIVKYALTKSNIDTGFIRESYEKYLKEPKFGRTSITPKLDEISCKTKNIPHRKCDRVVADTLRLLIHRYYNGEIDADEFRDELTTFLKAHNGHFHAEIYGAFHDDMKNIDLSYNMLFVEFNDGDVKTFENVEVKVGDKYLTAVRDEKTVEFIDFFGNIIFEDHCKQKVAIDLDRIKYWCHSYFNTEIKEEK